MTKEYLSIKMFLEPIVFGPALFWILFILFLVFYRSKYPKRRRLAEKIPVISLFLIIILVSPPIIEIISLPMYYAIPENLNNKADAIVVLGGGINDDGCPLPYSTERAYAGSKLFLKGMAPLLILTTGYTNSNVAESEAQAMRIIAVGIGVPDHKIILEEKSYNTHTSALETKKLLEKYNLKSIILVTSFSHLYRATKVFKKMGIEVYPYTWEVPVLFNWNISWGRPIRLIELFHEYTAIAIYKYKGWI